MARHFGTDGIRGRAGEELTPEFALRVGYAVGQVLRRRYRGRKLPYFRHRKKVVPAPAVMMARDPRISSPMLASAVTSGLLAAGTNVVDLGMLPTPVLALSLNAIDSIGGIVITASHNPIEDNGIKVFRSNGLKVGEGTEREIELLLQHSPEPLPHAAFGKVVNYDPREIYGAHLRRVLGSGKSGARVVLDLAYGAAVATATEAFSQFGYDVKPLHAKADGWKVNVRCGSTDLGALQRAVRRLGADWGLAFDGDGDRVLAVDADGEIVDGDKIMAILTLGDPRYRREHRLVFTQMSNLGVERYLRELGVTTYRTGVGDVQVLAEMRRRGINIGGEQSGHIICWDRQCTGDGVLVGLLLSGLLSRSERDLGSLAKAIPTYPQELVSLRVADPRGWQQDREFLRQLRRLTGKYNRQVRIVVRPSGTENVVRLLTEAEDAALARAARDEIAGLFAALEQA
ncbi:MAG: hypothetical protein B1H03_01915 [Planctomycetales bacterium 4484_113]|nr:MAG: hypothetical protein B1H03_01915 [Planctomycetales bacterium 4484_113]